MPNINSLFLTRGNSGESGGGSGNNPEPNFLLGKLVKESFRFTNFVSESTPTGAQIDFKPTKIKGSFVELVFSNTTKVEESEYTITSKGDGTYTLTLLRTANAATMVNLVLLAGEASQPSQGMTARLVEEIDYYDGELPVSLAQINIPDYNPYTHTLRIIRRSTTESGELINHQYTIIPSQESSSGYAISMTRPLTFVGEGLEIIATHVVLEQL